MIITAPLISRSASCGMHSTKRIQFLGAIRSGGTDENLLSIRVSGDPYAIRNQRNRALQDPPVPARNS